MGQFFGIIAGSIDWGNKNYLESQRYIVSERSFKTG